MDQPPNTAMAHPSKAQMAIPAIMPIRIGRSGLLFIAFSAWLVLQK
jgi:hypothetical protein